MLYRLDKEATVEMQPSTKELDIDLDALVKTTPAFISINSEFGNFIVADAPENLGAEYLKDRDGAKTEFFVSTIDDMIHGEVKVLVPISDKFYHFFMDSLPVILKIHRKDPRVMFILYLQKARPNPEYEKLLVLLFKILESIGAKYKLISTVPGMEFAPTYQFNNYITIDNKINIHGILSFVDVKYAVDFGILPAIEGQRDQVEPFRKVYLTRGGKGANIGPAAPGHTSYIDDLRMYEEEKLEKFFVDLGYEIIEPEVKFSSIMEQILYMREVKTLVSVTASGLANMIFMQNNQTVIEIQCEIVQPSGEPSPEGLIFKQGLHSYYQPLSFMNEHTFISIPTDRNPDKVIQALTKDGLSHVL